MNLSGKGKKKVQREKTKIKSFLFKKIYNLHYIYQPYPVQIFQKTLCSLEVVIVLKFGQKKFGMPITVAILLKAVKL